MPNPSRIAATIAQSVEIGGGLPVRRSDLIAGGLTPAQIKASIARGSLLGFQRGILLSRELWEKSDQAQQIHLAAHAALLAFPGCVASHHTAAALHGLPLPGSSEWMPRHAFKGFPGSAVEMPVIHLTRVRGRSITSRANLPWVKVHGGHGRVSAVNVAGLPSTDVITTAIDLGCLTSARWAVAILDAAWRQVGGAHADARQIRRDMRARIARHVRRPGIRRIRRVTPFINPAAESPLESISRWQMHRAHIPAPQCNVVVLGADSHEYRGDFCWAKQRVIGEADGFTKYESEQDFIAEKRRQLALEQAGWRVVRWSWQQAVVQPRVMVALVRQALSLPPMR